MVYRKDIETRQKLDGVAMERRILQESLEHPFVVQLNATFATAKYEYLVMEHCRAGDLFEVQGKFRGARMPEAAAKFYACEIILGIEHVHGLGFIVRTTQHRLYFYPSPNNKGCNRYGTLSLRTYWSTDSVRNATLRAMHVDARTEMFTK